MLRMSSISTATLLGSPVANVNRMQSELVRLNTEVVTGRMADVGLNLGSGTSQSVTLHIDLAALDTLASSNETVASRLTQTQAALDQMREGAESFLSLLVSSNSTDSPKTLVLAAQSALDSFVATANTSDGRNFLFGGINTGEAPLATDGSAEAAIDAAFLAKFGFTQDDPAAASIDAATMSDFLDNEFAALFDDPAWGTDWSSASDQTLSARISPSETLSTSLSANETAMRKLAQVYSMVASLGMDGMGSAARQTIIDKATGILGDAIDDVVVLQAGVGETQNRVSAASDRLTAQQSILETQIGTLEGVDATEAKVKIDTLSTQIEMSYSLTAKLLQMSLLNYV